MLVRLLEPRLTDRLEIVLPNGVSFPYKPEVISYVMCRLQGVFCSSS